MVPARVRTRSADPRQRLAEREVEQALASERGDRDDLARGTGLDDADARGAGAEGMSPQGGERAIGVGRRDEGDQPPLAGHLKGIDPQHLAGARDGAIDRDLGLVDDNPAATGRRDLVERGDQPAAGGPPRFLSTLVPHWPSSTKRTAWRPDSTRLVYAGDCGRGVGLTTLVELQAVR